MHEDGIPARMTSTDATRRMVCHACGERLPIGAVTSSSVKCCPRPDWHFHATAQPCAWCASDATPEFPPAEPLDWEPPLVAQGTIRCRLRPGALPPLTWDA